MNGSFQQRQVAVSLLAAVTVILAALFTGASPVLASDCGQPEGLLAQTYGYSAISTIVGYDVDGGSGNEVGDPCGKGEAPVHAHGCHCHGLPGQVPVVLEFNSLSTTAMVVEPSFQDRPPYPLLKPPRS